MISLISGHEDTRDKFLALDPPEAGIVGSQITTDTPKPLLKPHEGWQTFWLKTADEETFSTVVPDKNFTGKYNQITIVRYMAM